MCGIFGYVGKKNNAGQIVLNGLKKLEYRGYDSWGIGIKKSELSSRVNQKLKVFVEKDIGKIGEVKRSFPSGSSALGHTRWATHGGVTKINAHPHLDCTGRIVLVHNGIIENYEELKKRLLKKGHKFISETDTEVAVHLIENDSSRLTTGRGNLVETARKSFCQFQGLNAIVVMDVENGKLIAAKNGSPLVIGLGNGENFIASDAAALLSRTRRVIFLEDNQAAEITDKKVKIYHLFSGQEIKPRIEILNWKAEQIKKGKFPHFMLKEINEQPRVLENISKHYDGQAKKLAEMIHQSYGAYLVGCGTAGYACLAGQYIFNKIAKRHINFSVGSEFGYLLDYLTPKSLVLALSQSGETIDIIESVNKAKRKGAKIAALVNNLGSTLYRLADYKILLGAGPEKAVASTKAFTAKIAILILTAYAFVDRINKGKKMIKRTAEALKMILKEEYQKKIKELAKRIYKKEHIYIIGRGISSAAAYEAALKIKEVSYLHAEGFAAGELKHGVIALVEKGTPCLVFAPNDETYPAVISGAMEMKARGGFIIGISFKNNEVFDFYLPVFDCEEGTIITNVVVAQLLGYYLAIQKGLDPDKPRNLAKSVTVK